jgi:hypothetical protein
MTTYKRKTYKRGSGSRMTVTSKMGGGSSTSYGQKVGNTNVNRKQLANGGTRITTTTTQNGWVTKASKTIGGPERKKKSASLNPRPKKSGSLKRTSVARGAEGGMALWIILPLAILIVAGLAQGVLRSGPAPTPSEKATVEAKALGAGERMEVAPPPAEAESQMGPSEQLAGSEPPIDKPQPVIGGEPISSPPFSIITPEKSKNLRGAIIKSLKTGKPVKWRDIGGVSGYVSSSSTQEYPDKTCRSYIYTMVSGGVEVTSDAGLGCQLPGEGWAIQVE